MEDEVSVLEALSRLHEGLPRHGPGTDEETREALRRLPGLPAEARALDVGCGAGKQTGVLRRELPGTLVAIDIYRPYLEAARNHAPGTLLCQASMAALPFADGSFDLIWSEGAIYILGFEEGLRRWRPLLRPGGFVAVTEMSWLSDDPPVEARDFWAEEYPAMASTAENREKVTRAGYEMLDSFALSSRAWWDEYYHPLMDRIDQIAPLAQKDEALRGVIAATQREIGMYRRHGDSYGYVFYLMRRRD